MNHHSSRRKFGRKTGQRSALMRSLFRSLVLHKRITTTLAKAKELRPYAEKFVTKAKAGTVATRRDIISRTGSEEVAKLLIEKIAPDYKTRMGGYTRILKLPAREKDGSSMALIEFV